MNQQGKSKLAPPGAGLPALEQFIAKRRLSMVCLLSTQASQINKFKNEQNKIADLINSISPTHRNTPVLIKRLRGLEDSSRQWSVWMTLDHLRIVNHQIATFINLLVQGQTPTQVVSTADVKPQKNQTEEIEVSYSTSCQHIISALKNNSDLKTTTTHMHPWFGLLDAHSWANLAGMHMAIHRGQIQKIIKNLPT